MSDYKFLLEKPSNEDLFNGGSHSRIAQSVYQTLKDDNNINVIGVEGELGSGKSTIIEFVKNQSINQEYDFIEFDVERFQHGATKKALIETLYHNIKKVLPTPDSKDRVKKAKDMALGNYFEYTSQVKSSISMWVIVFALSLLVASKVFIEASVGLGNTIKILFNLIFGDLTVSELTVEPFVIFSFAVVLFPAYIIYCSSKEKKLFGYFSRPPTVGELFKRNSRDKISETTEITKEVGSYELQEALQVFVDELPDDSRFILVIDNLDRVTSEKLREVWSDIEVFTSIAQNKIQLILPYSNTHIASALSEKGEHSDANEGKEFISKRVPVTFRVSPITSADWKNQCETMIAQSIQNIDRNELPIIIKLIDLWSEFMTKQITPRYLKKLINSVVSIKITDNENVSVTSAFFYQLVIQFCEIPLEKVLSKNIDHTFDADNTETLAAKLDAKLKKSFPLIQQQLSFEQWSKELAAIHYQTSFEIAESELLGEPLRRALHNGDSAPFIEKQNIYGYEETLRSLLAEESTEDIVGVMAHMADEAKTQESVGRWFDKWLPVIDGFIGQDDNNIKDINSWIDNHATLKNANISVNSSRLKKEFSMLDLTSNQYARQNEPLENLKSLHGLSKLLCFTPKLFTQLSAELFMKELWPHRNTFSYWEIDKITLTQEFVTELYDNAATTKYINDDLLAHVASNYKVGWPKGNKVLDRVFNTWGDSSTINNNPLSVEQCIYYSSWYSDYNDHHFMSQYSNIEDSNARQKWLALSIAHIIYHQYYSDISQFEAYLNESEDFSRYLTNYLTISCDFDRILEALSDDQINKYLKDSVKELVRTKRVNKQQVSNTISHMDELVKTGLSKTEIIVWLSSFSKYQESLQLGSLQNTNSNFVEAVFDIEENTAIREKYLNLLSSESANAKWWLTQIQSPNNNIRYIFENWFESKHKKFVSCSNLVSAIRSFVKDTEPRELALFNDKTWLVTLFKSIPNKSQDALSRLLSKELNQKKTPIETQAAILSIFGEFVHLTVSNDTDEQVQALTLFEHFDENLSDDNASWFDIQHYQFEHWSEALLTSFVEKLKFYEAQGYSFHNINTDQSISNLKNVKLDSAD
ncbi:hypothetical protein J7384_05625 [Endozoicomonas sp. G2_1]|uniref:P-loop NTPase fold protein n=1 Tax=Endozoicomonas sp. G2_1 TaxID=2821091 RepID=UPI001ADD3943|nr:P-loop NTPase fold protein [Endozoicomonas sp. G2_1]MBO9489835.1 hypothetical protein [Endozoicomonas sp. G2_1]